MSTDGLRDALERTDFCGDFHKGTRVDGCPYCDCTAELRSLLAAHPETDDGAAAPGGTPTPAAEATFTAAPSSLDRDAVVEVLVMHVLGRNSLGGDLTCGCGWSADPTSSMTWAAHVTHVADAIVALSRPISEVKAEERARIAQTIETNCPGSDALACTHCRSAASIARGDS